MTLRNIDALFSGARATVFGRADTPAQQQLLANLQASLDDGALTDYQPQSKWLSILDLGDGTGLATRGQRWWLGRSSVWLKHWLDRRFIESYRV